MPRLSRFTPPLVWMGLIALASGDWLSGAATGARILPVLAALVPWAGPETLHAALAALRKLGHLITYGVLGLFWLRALAGHAATPGAGRWAIGLAALYGGIDEGLQSLAPERSGSALDVAVDALGATGAVSAVRCPAGAWRLGRAVAAAIGVVSLAATAVDAWLGLPVWDLVLATGGAGALAWIGARRARAAGSPATGLRAAR